MAFVQFFVPPVSDPRLLSVNSLSCLNFCYILNWIESVHTFYVVIVFLNDKPLCTDTVRYNFLRFIVVPFRRP